jgi:hypothetical protein
MTNSPLNFPPASALLANSLMDVFGADNRAALIADIMAAAKDLVNKRLV